MSLPEFFKKAICALVALFVHTTFAFDYNVEMRFAPIFAGEFMMGGPSDENQVGVKLTRNFEMQITEVTQLQWFEIMGKKSLRPLKKKNIVEVNTE